MIRLATPEDIPGIVLLIYALHQESDYREKPFDHKHTAKQVAEFYYDNALPLVYESEGEIKAALGAKLETFGFNPQLRAHEYLFYVKPEVRGSSVAGRMLKWFIDWAKTHNATPMVTMSSGINHNEYEKFLSSAGFSESGKQFVLGE